MSRTLGGALVSHLATRTHTRATCLRLDLVDGTSLGITDHDRALSFDLGDGAIDYSPNTGILPSDLDLSAGFEADDIEVTGPITSSGLTTRTQILGGRFDEATARLFQVNWKSLGSGAIKLLKGYVANAEADESSFRLTIHSEVSRFAQQRGRVISAYCDADFGDARCGMTPDTLAATVTGVTDERQFAISFAGTESNDYFNRGTVQFTSGALNGTRPVEIFDFTGGVNAGSIVLWMPLPEAPQVGDTLTLTQGCYDLATNTSKTRAACMAFDNIENFRGFPDVPGTDQVLRYPNPGG
jgi:uncharacterized phage protein (TIGR02218 family)